MTTKGNVDVTIKGKDQLSGSMHNIGNNADKMAARFKKAGMIMMGVGAGLLAMVGKMVNDYGKAGDEVAKMAKRTGFATEALSELRHVAELSGSSLASIETATKKMSRAIIEARDGVTTYTDIFNQLGISMDTLAGQTPEEQFWTVAKALGDLEDQTLKTALAQEVFGRAGTDLLPMLNETSESIDAMRQEAHDLGIVFDESSAKAAEAYEDAKTRLKAAFTGIANSLGETLMPAITDLIESLTERLKPIIEWLTEHPEWIKAGVVVAGLTMIGGAVLILLPKLIALWSSLVAVQAMMGPAGWAKIAAGLIIAGGAIAGLIALTGATSSGGATSSSQNPELRAAYDKWQKAKEGGSAQEEYEAWKHFNDLYVAAGKPKSFYSGGTVPGPRGKPVLVTAHGGEEFAGVGKSFGPSVVIHNHGSVITVRELFEEFREYLYNLKDQNVTLGFD